MAGKGKKAGKNLKSPSHMRYNEAKNKALTKKRHEKLILNQEIRKEERLELTKKCVEKLKTNKSELRRKFGTLNIQRLTDILNNTYYSANWYISRIKKAEAPNDRIINSTIRKSRRKEAKKIS